MDEKLYTMTYTLNSGIKNTVNLSPIQIEQWVKCYQNNEKFVAIIGKEYFGINPELVADFKVHNAFSEHRNDIEPIKQTFVTKELVDAFESREKIHAKIDCKKCDTIYATQLDYKKTKVMCTKCKSDVYLDQDKGIIFTGKGNGYYYTNRRVGGEKKEL